MTEQARVFLTSAATTAAKAGGYGWLGAAACAIAIGVSYLIDMFGADDQIDRTRDYFLDAGKASGLTTHVNPARIAPLHFDGGDSDGIYDIYMKLRRV